MKRYLPYLSGVGFATIFGFSFLVTKDALALLDPFELLFARFALGTALMALLALCRAIRLDYRGKKLLPLLFVCLLQPILYFSCETFGVNESPSSLAGIVIGALPAAVAVASALMLKERLGLLQGASLGLSVLGVAVVVLLGGSLGGSATLRGFLFLLGALASATLYNVFVKKASERFSPAETTFAMMASGLACFGAVALIRGIIYGRLAGPDGLFTRTLSAAPGVLYLGILSSVAAFFLLNFTLSKVKASQSAVFANLTTVVAVAAGVAFRGEAFGSAQIVGSVMIVLGVWGTNFFNDRSRKRPEGGSSGAEGEP